MDPAAQQPAAPLFPTPNLHAFHAVLLVLDVLYIAFARIQHKAFRRGNMGGWPNVRHKATRTSRLCVAVHVMAGTGVLVLGGSLFIASHWTRSFSPAAFTCMAALGVAQSLTVLPLLGKVEGVRTLTVPWYLSVAAMMLCSSLRLLAAPSLPQAMLVWRTVNTFVWVRFFVFVYDLVSSADYHLLYTVSVALGGVFGFVVAGQDPRWLWIYASPVAYAPFMAVLTQLSQSRWPLVAWAARVCAEAMGPDLWEFKQAPVAQPQVPAGAAAQCGDVATPVHAPQAAVMAGPYVELRASIQQSMRAPRGKPSRSLGVHHTVAS